MACPQHASCQLISNRVWLVGRNRQAARTLHLQPAESTGEEKLTSPHPGTSTQTLALRSLTHQATCSATLQQGLHSNAGSAAAAAAAAAALVKQQLHT